MIVRAPQDGEWNFIRAGWVRSSSTFPPCRVYRPEGGSMRTKWMGQRDWTAMLSARFARLERMASYAVAELEGALLGFVCWSPGALHYVYTEYRFRRRGVASELLRTAGLDEHTVATHWTPHLELLPQCTRMVWDETRLEDR
jgi:GNAT superfamily N-acetyltransferase